MKEHRNPEVWQESLVIFILTILGAVIGFFLYPGCAAVIAGMGGVFLGAHLYFARRRYTKLEHLSNQIDRILHGQEKLLTEEYTEGELSILYSEIQKMTVRLQEQNDQLQDKQIQLTHAIEDIFHQLRTPLTSMNLVVSLLRSEDLPDERRVQLARELKTQLERIQWLVEALLKLSKMDAGTATFTKETVKVSEMLTKAAEPFLIPMELRGQTLEIKAGKETFTGDFGWSVEAFGNLLKNAMEHVPEGGVIRVEAEETALYTLITVSDTGEGFCKEDIPHLFERFYKGKNASPNSIGIGLALTRMIIVSQNGTITAENGAGGGAKFTVKFYKSVV